MGDLGLEVKCIPQFSRLGHKVRATDFTVDVHVHVPESTATTEGGGKRAPVDLVCVIDRSGSMSGSKIILVKETLSSMVHELDERDQLAIVLFDSEVDVLCDFVRMDAVGRSHVAELVQGIACRSCTNLSGGLVQAISLLRAREVKNDVASVFLLTDGEANEGFVLLKDIVRAMEDPSFVPDGNDARRARYAASNMMAPPMIQQQMPVNLPPQTQIVNAPPMQMMPSMFPVVVAPPAADDHDEKVSGKEEKKQHLRLPIPCSINCFGYGESHNDTLLREIATNFRGLYYFMENTQRIEEAFADALGGLVSTAMQDIRLTVTAPLDVKISKMLTSFSHQVVDSQKAVVSFGDLQYGEKRDLLVQLDVDRLDHREDAQVILEVTLDYLNVVKKSQETHRAVCVIERQENSSELVEDHSVSVQLNRFLAADAMERANEVAKTSLDEARAILNEACERISGSLTASDPFCVNLVTDLKRCESLLADRNQYVNVGAKTLTTNMMCHQYQRSTHQGYEAQSAYVTASRAKVSKTMKSRSSSNDQ